MARLLVDMAVSAQLALDSLSTQWVSLPRAAGPRCWAFAHGDAVFTHDLDFGSVRALSGADGPSVEQVRCLNVLPEAVGPLVLSALRFYGAERLLLVRMCAPRESPWHRSPSPIQGPPVTRRLHPARCSPATWSRG
jgi:predicted nuclease of predicted toxin-antitoxin system